MKNNRKNMQFIPNTYISKYFIDDVFVGDDFLKIVLTIITVFLL